MLLYHINLLINKPLCVLNFKSIFWRLFMKRKIIYVDFIKKRRITFIHFIMNKFISLLSIKFKIRTSSSKTIEISKNRRISN